MGYNIDANSKFIWFALFFLTDSQQFYSVKCYHTCIKLYYILTFLLGNKFNSDDTNHVLKLWIEVSTTILNFYTFMNSKDI